MRFPHELATVLRAKAAGDDHLAVLVQRLADGVERFGDGGVDEAAGVDDDEVGTVVRWGDHIAFGPKLGQDLLRIDERLGAAERDEAHARGGRVQRASRR
jgi:hypothetical protein